MSKDPAVLFYTSDFLSGVGFFTMEERGQYITLLCEQHQIGHIPENHMISICSSIDSPVIKKFIKDENGLYYNKRMEEEKEKRLNYCKSRSNNKSGRKKKITKKSYDKSCEKHMSIHMGNGNDNGNKDGIEDRDKKNVKVFNLKHRECSKLLEKRILERRQQKITDSTLDSWDNEVRLMIERDNRTIEEIQNLINECHDMQPRGNNGFTWRDCILSMGKLRKQWNDGKIFIGMNNSGGVTRQSIARTLNLELD